MSVAAAAAAATAAFIMLEVDALCELVAPRSAEEHASPHPLGPPGEAFSQPPVLSGGGGEVGEASGNAPPSVSSCISKRVLDRRGEASETALH